MGPLLAGIAILLVTAVLFLRCLPRNGEVSRLIGTEWEPYVAVTFAMGAILGVGFFIFGLMELFGGA